MGELSEIVDLHNVDRLFVVLAIAMPVAGIAAGFGLRAWGRSARESVVGGAALGIAGPLNWVLWRIYNIITDHNGLDSVRNLIVNLVLFAAVGAVIGWIFARIYSGSPHRGDQE